MREVWTSYTITNVIHSMKVNALISLMRFVMSLRIDNVTLKTKENVPHSMLQSVRQSKKDLVLQSTIDNVALLMSRTATPCTNHLARLSTIVSVQHLSRGNVERKSLRLKQPLLRSKIG